MTAPRGDSPASESLAAHSSSSPEAKKLLPPRGSRLDPRWTLWGYILPPHFESEPRPSDREGLQKSGSPQVVGCQQADLGNHKQHFLLWPSAPCPMLPASWKGQDWAGGSPVLLNTGGSGQAPGLGWLSMTLCPPFLLSCLSVPRVRHGSKLYLLLGLPGVPTATA